MYRSSSKIYTLDSLLRRIAAWRLKDEKIVFTNGCFDLLHLGHVDYLENAAALGSRLVIGLNNDASVRRIKGEDRPVQDEKSRAHVLSALQFVDAVVFFNEETPLELIKQVKPDVLVKGDDYSVEEIVGHEFVQENGGSVKTVPFLEGYSTSRLIQRIKNS